MRLVNNRFAVEQKMFWDERAIDLEAQVVQPIQDHIEMGFSGTNGQPGVSELVTRLQNLAYYRELFAWVYDGDSTVTLGKMGEALTDFVNSIESYDAKFDDGYTNQAALPQPFSNFTPQENQGKALFLAVPNVDINGIRTGGGAGCAGCHQPPEFDIDPNSGNNGVDHVAGDPASADFTNTRSPSLRDVIGPNGQPNGPMMHTGDFIEFQTVIEHYNEVIPDVNNNMLDMRLRRDPNRLQLELTATERAALEAFVKTLTGSNVYTDARWSDPF
jgi:cytochrome c peroxidase